MKLTTKLLTLAALTAALSGTASVAAAASHHDCRAHCEDCCKEKKAAPAASEAQPR